MVRKEGIAVQRLCPFSMAKPDGPEACCGRACIAWEYVNERGEPHDPEPFPEPMDYAARGHCSAIVPMTIQMHAQLPAGGIPGLLGG